MVTESTEKKESALTTPAETGFAIVDEPQAREMLLSTFDQMGISNFQLGRVKIPAGGSRRVGGVRRWRSPPRLDLPTAKAPMARQASG